MVGSRGNFFSFFLVLVLCISTLMPFFITSVQAESKWKIEEIGKYSMDIAVYHSLALDSNNHPHISFWDDTAFAMDLKYAKRDETSWTFVNVDQDADVGRFSSIALDSNNYPHITYMNYSAGTLLYARWDGTTWHKEVIGACGSAGLGGGYSSIALDSNDHPHISYFNAFYLDLYYATWDGTTWHKEMVDGYLTKVGHYNSIALDSNDHPHISYYDYDHGYLRHAWWDGTTWSTETVDTSMVYVGMYTSLTLDSNDNPHISYYGFNTIDHGLLRYAWWDGTTWSTETVDTSTGDIGRYTSLALDSNDNPHISYYRISPGFALKYATKTGSTWSTEQVDLLEDFTGTDFNIKVYSSLALDSYDNPHIIYADMYWLMGTFNWYLKYATVDASSPEVAKSYLVVRGSDNSIYYRGFSGDWGDWKVVPSGTTCDSPCAVFHNDKLYLVVRGMDGNSLYFGYVNLVDDSFSGWSWISGSTPSKPILVSAESSDIIVLLVRGTNNLIYTRKYDSSSDVWSGWNQIPTGSTNAAPAAMHSGSYVYIVVRGMDNGLYHGRLTISSNSFTGWSYVGGSTPSDPTITNYDLNQYYLVVRGNDNIIYYNAYNGYSWSGYAPIPGATTGYQAYGPAATSITVDQLDVVVLSSNGHMYHGYYNFDTGIWEPWNQLSGSTPCGPTLTN